MKRFLTLLIIMVLCASVVLAQDKKIVIVGNAEPPKAGSAATPAKTPTPTTGTTPSTATEPVYVYAGTGTQLAFSTTELGDADKPKDWTKMSLVQVYNVQPSAMQSFMEAAEQFGTKPSAVYDGNIVFANDKGELRIIDGAYVYEYDADGNVILGGATRNPGGETEAEFTQRAAEAYEKGFSQFGSLSNTLGTFVQYYRIYAGLSGWSSLIFDEDQLAEWREQVNYVMCDMLSLPTQQCWTSKICNKYTDIGSSQAGVAFAAGAGGVPQAFAHIEAQRSLPIITPNQTSWVYTATFGLRNPSDEESMSYNVRFKGPKYSAYWWPETQTLGKKGSMSVLGASALMKLSLHEYTEVCLEFDPGIQTPASGGLLPSFESSGSARISEICNAVVQYAGGATAPYPVAIGNATNETTAAGAAPSAPGTPGGSI